MILAHLQACEQVFKAADLSLANPHKAPFGRGKILRPEFDLSADQAVFDRVKSYSSGVNGSVGYAQSETT